MHEDTPLDDSEHENLLLKNEQKLPFLYFAVLQNSTDGPSFERDYFWCFLRPDINDPLVYLIFNG